MVKFSYPTLGWLGSKNTTVKTLKKARKLIKEKGWAKQSFCEVKDPATGKPLGNYCTIGALCSVLSEGNYSSPTFIPDGKKYDTYRECLLSLSRSIVPNNFTTGFEAFPVVRDYNDAPSTSKEHILALFDRAIAEKN